MNCESCLSEKTMLYVCVCGRKLCEKCGLQAGCCGRRPPIYSHATIQGRTITADDDAVDEDGDKFDEPTPTVEVDPFDPDWHEIGGSE